jgi:hypothetical protein
MVNTHLGNTIHLNTGALGKALEATSRFGNQRNCLFGRETRFMFVFFTHRRHPAGLCDKDTGVGDTFERAPTGAF